MSTSSKGALFKAIVFDAIINGYVLILLFVGVFHPSEEQLLDLRSNSLVALGIFVFAAIGSYVLILKKFKTLGVLLFGTVKQTLEVAKPWYKTFWGWELFVSFWLTFYVGLIETNFSVLELFSGEGIAGAGRIFSGFLHPTLGLLPQAVVAIVQTVYIAFMATVISLPPAFLLSFLCAKNIMGDSPLGALTYFTLRAVLNLARSIEPIIWAIVFSVWVGIGPFAGMLALMVHSVASLAKQYSEIIECVDNGPIEGIESTGAGRLQVVWFGVVPQVILPYVSFTIFRWDINVRMATIIGIVGGGGIGTLLMQYLGQGMWPEVGCLGLVITIVVWVMDVGSAYIREALK